MPLASLLTFAGLALAENQLSKAKSQAPEPITVPDTVAVTSPAVTAEFWIGS
jgi:hypothetical protein